jgi:D-sedoheptulose 7-phosphate isomerase
MTASPAESVAHHLRRLAGTAQAVAVQLAGEIGQIAETIVHTFEAGGKVLFCGNGGSAADAQHLATEYVVRFRRHGRPLAAIALTTDTSLLTAAANDLGFESVFARQIDALGQAGDLLVVHSTSGVSPNLLAAARAARARGLGTVALLARGGGPLRELVDRAVVLPTDDPAHAQELQIAIGHAVCDVVERRLRAAPDADAVAAARPDAVPAQAALDGGS